MKKISAALICLSLSFQALAGAQVRWADVYQSGPVKLSPDPSFGTGVDWGSFLFESYKDVAVAGDGTVFVTNSREHTIHKFDPAGRKVLTFGRHGQGPGDLENPGSPSILDGKYLVVSEYPLTNRISLFDLNGKFYKLLKTQRPVYDAAALTGTKIAYLSQQFESKGADRNKPGVQSMPMTVRVVLKDIETGGERVILTRTMSQKMIMLESGGALSFGDDLIGGVYIASCPDGNLAVGVANSPQIEIFDKEGKLLRTFTLNKQPRPVTSDYIARYKKVQIEAMKSEGDKIPARQKLIGELERLDFSPLFERTLPCYKEMLTDSDGNFLLFDRTENPGHPDYRFSAYSPQGQFIAETSLDPDAFDIEIDYRFRRLRFSKAGLIGLAPLKNDGDQLPVLFRSVPNPKK